MLLEEILTGSTNKTSHEESSLYNTSSYNTQINREIRMNIIENKLDDYVNNRRNEIYARMKMPKALANHYVVSANMSHVSVDNMPYDIFDKNALNASKSCFEGNSQYIEDIGQPFDRKAALDGKIIQSTIITAEGLSNPNSSWFKC